LNGGESAALAERVTVDDVMLSGGLATARVAVGYPMKASPPLSSVP